MSEDQIKEMIRLITDVKSNTDKIGQQLKIVDKGLSLIEQRLTSFAKLN